MKNYIVTMSSEEYGTEEFTYDTHAEALAGMERLENKAIELNDGIEREFELEVTDELH